MNKISLKTRKVVDQEKQRETVESNTISTDGMQRIVEAFGAQVSDSQYEMFWLVKQAKDIMLEEKRQSFTKLYNYSLLL